MLRTQRRASAEIGGCFFFWIWRRDGRSAWSVSGGIALLAIFAWLLTRVDSAFAGRAFAAYAGVYIITSLTWLWIVEGVLPDRAELIGACLSLAGSAVILLGRKTSRIP